MTHEDDRTLAHALIAARGAGRACVLATIVATKGSTPRKVGARMLVDPDHGLVGTVGGGCGEAEVIESAHRVLGTGVPERVRVDLTEDFTSWSPAVCGGVMDVFVELVGPPRTALVTSTRRVAIHYRRLPDRTRVYDQRVVLEREDVVVTLSEPLDMEAPMVHDDRTMLEAGSLVVWFTFPDAWHDIGRFYAADGRSTGLYANIITPPIMEGTVWHTTDLFLDLWWPREGTPTILDEDEFEDALAKDWMDEETALRARAEAKRLLARATAGAWPPPVVSEWTLARALEEVG